MKPILFAENATQFNTNGIGRLDCISCNVVEERNGIYELEMVIAENVNHVSNIEIGAIVVAKPSQGGAKQPFRIYKITKPINGQFEVYAQHISYQLSYIPTMPFSIASSANAAAQTLTALKANAVETCPFNFSTDVNVVSSYKQTIPASIRSRLGGVKGSVLDQFGGEYEWDVYDVKLWKNRGLTVPQVTLRYGKNIIDFNQEENIENTITGIVPYWQSSEGDTTVTLTEKVIDSQYASTYPFKRTIPYDFSQDFENAPTEAQLRTKAQAYVNASGIGIPSVSIKVSFINLADTEEYKHVAALQVVNLCDVVGVYFEKLGISTTAKVVKTNYDVLSERYNSIEIGSIRSTLSNTISDTSGAIENVANNTRNMFKEYNNTVNNLVDNATAWLTSGDGYVVAHKNQDGSWKELLFLDTADENEAHNVLRVNQNGIGFSSTGIAGPYTQAWTLDGKLVIGGTNVPSLTVYKTGGAKLFEVTKDGIIWNVTNSEMDINGNLTANSATLTNATITGGTLKIVANSGGQEIDVCEITNNGALKIRNLSNNVIFDVDRDGVAWSQSGTENNVAYSSSMTKKGHLTAYNASLHDASINGGSLYQENNGRYMQLVNGNIHGGPIGGDYVLYFAYNVGSTGCICISADGIALDASNIYIRDYRGSQYHTAWSGEILENMQTDGPYTFEDVNGNTHSMYCVTGADKRHVYNGIVC